MKDTDEKHIIKNIRQYSFDLSGEDYCRLMVVSRRYNNVKNYVYGRYSGIRSMNLLRNYRKEIRDVWVESGFAEQWNLPARYCKIALDDAIGSIKSNWSNTKNDCRKWFKRNGNNINGIERYLFFYILKSDNHLFKILNKERCIAFPDKFNEVSLERRKYLFNLICRLIRKYKRSKPRTEKKTISLDADMYSYKDGFIEIMSANPRKRISLKTNTDDIFTGNIKLTFDRKMVTINRPILIKKIGGNNIRKEIGLDKNYENVVASSSGEVYGDGINKSSTKYAETLCNINKKRNKFRDIINKYKEKIANKETSEKDKKHLQKKINNISNNNLGEKKYGRTKNRLAEAIYQETNKAINEMIFSEKPSEIVSENLTFTSNGHKERGRKNNRLMASWTKGYMRKRIDYKTKLNNITLTEVNAAYTSQTCSDCGCLGIRKSDKFYCPICGKAESAHINASKVILNRKYDKEIELYTPYAKVRNIIVKRTITAAGNQLDSLLLIYKKNGIDLLKGYWSSQDFGRNTPKSELQKNISKTITK